MQALEIADLYLAQRAVTVTHAATVRRVAGRCGILDAPHINAYLKARLERHSTVTARTDR